MPEQGKCARKLTNAMTPPFNLVCEMISASGDPTDEAGVANWAPCKIDLDGGSSVVDDILSECDLGLLSRSSSIDDARVHLCLHPQLLRRHVLPLRLYPAN